MVILLQPDEHQMRQVFKTCQHCGWGLQDAALLM